MTTDIVPFSLTGAGISGTRQNQAIGVKAWRTPAVLHLF
jgi:hypothetical protein